MYSRQSNTLLTSLPVQSHKASPTAKNTVRRIGAKTSPPRPAHHAIGAVRGPPFWLARALLSAPSVNQALPGGRQISFSQFQLNRHADPHEQRHHQSRAQEAWDDNPPLHAGLAARGPGQVLLSQSLRACTTTLLESRSSVLINIKQNQRAAVPAAGPCAAAPCRGPATAARLVGRDAARASIAIASKKMRSLGPITLLSQCKFSNARCNQRSTAAGSS